MVVVLTKQIKTYVFAVLSGYRTVCLYRYDYFYRSLLMNRKAGKKLASSIGLGVSLGVPVGVVLGLILGNLSQGIALGVALGVVIGATIGSIKNSEYKKNIN